MSEYNLDKIKDAMYNSCKLVALVSNNEFIITKDEICNFGVGEHVSYFALFDYIRKFVTENSLKRYNHTFDTERVARLLNDPTSVSITPEFQLKIDGAKYYRPYQFSIVRSGEYTAVTISLADDRAFNVLDSAMSLLSCAIQKILLINASDDSFAALKVCEKQPCTKKISEWLKTFADCNIAEDDKDAFLTYCNNIGKDCKGYGIGALPKPISYRRCVNSAEYRWAIMYTIPTMNFTEDNKEMFLFVIDVQEQYIIQVEKERELGRFEYYDTFTGLHNKRAFQNRVARLHGQRVSLGYLCLKDEAPDGFDSYDEYIKFVVEEMVLEFGEDRCYRISDKEFVILSVGTKTLNSTPSSFDNVYFGTSYSDGVTGYSSLYDEAVEAANN